MLNLLLNLFRPSVDQAIKGVNSAIDNLTRVSNYYGTLAVKYSAAATRLAFKADEASEERDRADRVATKLKDLVK